MDLDDIISNNSENLKSANPPNGANESKTTKYDTDVLPFLKGLKLEEYHDKMVESGGDKLGQLIYVDDQTIDEFCKEINMKVIHAGVFKRALRECKNTNRQTSADYNERHHVNGPELRSHSSRGIGQYTAHPYYHEGYSPHERPRMMFASDASMCNGLHRGAPMNTSVQPDNFTCYSKFQPCSNSDVYVKPPYFAEDRIRVEHEKHMHQIDAANQPSNKSSVYNESGLEILPDCSYVVQVGDRMVKFPPTVKRLTHIDRIDPERLDIIKKGAQIYGRDDTKRKNNELTPLEVFMNDMAFEVCIRDFTYMISRQRLLALVREIYKDNQLQLSGHHHSTNVSAGTSHNLRNQVEKPHRETLSSQSGITQAPVTNPPHDQSMNDYDILLYYKINKEWPYGITKEAKKYLGRRASTFELIDNALYYVKDDKRRLWVDDTEGIEKTFFKFHIDKDTGSHYSKESTIDRISQFIYIKNLSQIMNGLFLKCPTCQENLKTQLEEIKRRRTGGRFQTKEDESGIVSGNSLNESSELPPLTILDPGQKRKFLENSTSEQVPTKRPRKSTPKKLVLSNLENDIVEHDAPDALPKIMDTNQSIMASESTIYQDAPTAQLSDTHTQEDDQSNNTESDYESCDHSQ